MRISDRELADFAKSTQESRAVELLVDLAVRAGGSGSTDLIGIMQSALPRNHCFL